MDVATSGKGSEMDTLTGAIPAHDAQRYLQAKIKKSQGRGDESEE